MSDVLLTKRIEFSASHRYQNDAWDAERNRRVFGACNNHSGHGHNYLLEVTIRGAVTSDTGMVVNLYDLKEILKQVLIEFDHKHLNLDTPYFQTTIPTTENIAGVLWRVLSRRSEIGRLEKVRLFEDEDLYADVTASDIGEGGQLRSATFVRRYQFAAAHRTAADRSPACGEAGAHGHNYELEIAVSGPVSADTGMVTDLTGLDRVVDDMVLAKLGGHDLTGIVPMPT